MNELDNKAKAVDQSSFIFPENPLNKVWQVVKKNIFSIFLLLLSLVYILNSFLDVVPSGMTWQDVLYDSALGMAMGFSIKDNLRLNGIKAGLESKLFLDTEKDYHNELNSIEEDMQYLDGYCDRENSYLKIQIIKNYLEKYGLSYRKYLEKFYESKEEFEKLNWKQKWAIKRVEKIKITPISYSYIASDENASIFKSKKPTSISAYKGRKRISSVISMIAISLVFGLYTVDLATDFSISKLIWYGIQISIWLMFGLWEYIESTQWVKTDYRLNYVNKIAHIKKFKSLINKDRKWFEDYEERRNKSLIQEKEMEEKQIETTY